MTFRILNQSAANPARSPFRIVDQNTPTSIRRLIGFWRRIGQDGMSLSRRRLVAFGLHAQLWRVGFAIQRKPSGGAFWPAQV